MDRGDLQREQARYKTQVIAQIKSAIRGNELPGTSQVMEHEPDTLAAKGPAASSHPALHLTHEIPLDRASEAMRSEALNYADLSAEPVHDQTVTMRSYNQPASDCHQTLRAMISPGIKKSNVRGSIDVSRSNSSSEVSIGAVDLLCNPMSSEYCSSDWSGYSSEAEWSLASQPAGPSKSILHGDVEDILFMYYFDHVFYMYFPFYFPSNRQGRGWLLSILKRANSAYHAALALSEYHHSTSTQHSVLCPTKASSGRYELALQELQTILPRSSAWAGNIGLSDNIEVLTAILHLLFYEVRSCSSLVLVTNANRLA